MMKTTMEETANGARLVTADGRTLPLKAVRVTADARGGVAEVLLEHRFENPYDEALRVTYLFPLPADGAVSGYAFTLGERRVSGEVETRPMARERFERALLEGRSAGILEQERSSLFTQELGNLPARAQVVAELRIDQRLRWLDEGAWEWRFPTAVGPRYTGGRVADAAQTEVAVADAALPVKLTMSLRVRDPGRPESSVLGLATQSSADGWLVKLGDASGMRLDRDLVVRWPAATPRVGLTLDAGRRAGAATAHALMTLVPPAPSSAEARPRPRDLILLLDTSGSMSGEPLTLVKKVCAALIDSLGEPDRLEMIEFSSSARRWQRQAVHVDETERRKAHKWLTGLSTGGGTEMVEGVIAALDPLSAEAQRQVVLLTDGYIGFETEVVRALSARLPPGSRLHVVGVGSAVNRSLTAPAARAGRGAEVIVAPGEDLERAVLRLLARSAAPIVTDVEVRGSALRRATPKRLPDLHAGAPALAALELDPAGGSIVVRGRTAFGAWEQSLIVPPMSEGQGSQVASTLFARELVEDLELEGAMGANVDAEIERVGLAFQIATRVTTWVAISEEPTVPGSTPTRRERIPQELPHGISAEGLGLRKAIAPMAATRSGSGAYGAITVELGAATRSKGDAPRKESSTGGLLDFEGIKVLGNMPDRFVADSGTTWLLIDEIDILDGDSEAKHAFVIAEAKDSYKSRQKLRYPDGTVVEDIGRAHVGGYCEYKVLGVTPGKPLLILRRTDYVYGDYELELFVNGRRVQVSSCMGTDRINRWRNWPFLIPADWVTESTLLIKQAALSSGRDINMFHYWFFQPR